MYVKFYIAANKMTVNYLKRNSVEFEKWKLRMHCNLKPRDVAPIVLGFFCQICILCVHTNCYFSASYQNSDIAL